MVVVIPDNIEVTDTAMLWMAEGHHDEKVYPDLSNKDLFVAADIATSSLMVTAAFYPIPNEPIVYSEDPLQVQRSEDSILAFLGGVS